MGLRYYDRVEMQMISIMIYPFRRVKRPHRRFEAAANVMGVPSVSLVYHKPDGALPDDGAGQGPSDMAHRSARGGAIGASDSRFR